jgi:hypothetical protein
MKRINCIMIIEWLRIIVDATQRNVLCRRMKEVLNFLAGNADTKSIVRRETSDRWPYFYTAEE